MLFADFSNTKFWFPSSFLVTPLFQCFEMPEMGLVFSPFSANSYTRKWFNKFWLEMLFLDDSIKSKEKRQNFKICKPISLSLLNFCFNNFLSFLYLSLHNGFCSRIWSKMSFTSASLKNWRHVVQTLRLIILDFFTGNSFSSDRRMYLDAIIRQ